MAWWGPGALWEGQRDPRTGCTVYSMNWWGRAQKRQILIGHMGHPIQHRTCVTQKLASSVCIPPLRFWRQITQDISYSLSDFPGLGLFSSSTLTSPASSISSPCDTEEGLVLTCGFCLVQSFIRQTLAGQPGFL